MRKQKRLIKSPIKQKVLLLLATGVLLGLTRSPRQYFRIVRTAAKVWRFIDRNYLYQLVKEFKENRLVDYREKPNGEIEVILTEQGRKMTLRFDLDKLQIKPARVWDGRWRVLIFDIPEKKRPARDALRDKLKELGFHELQRSVFIQPYPCELEINFINEVFDIRNYVRLIEADRISNEAELLIRFGLDKKLERKRS
ncbi:MAG: hypothetical protein HY481_00350 [Candidatus Vogelbacteria bacterium]|nr:hypothetical protein [Candidatus Vogelbacteria bacterium]